MNSKRVLTIINMTTVPVGCEPNLRTPSSLRAPNPFDYAQGSALSGIERPKGRSNLTSEIASVAQLHHNDDWRKNLVNGMPRNNRKISRKNSLSKKGFTLVELIMTVAILAFGIVSVYEALFVSVDTFGYYTHYLSTQDWISEKIWEVQEELTSSQVLEAEQTSGQIVRDHKRFDWVVKISELDEDQSLYRVHITLSWQEGNKRVSTTRETYLIPPQLREYNEESPA